MNLRCIHSLSLVMAALVLFIMSGCGDYTMQYENSISSGDYVIAKTLMRQQVEEYSRRDFNPTSLLRIARCYYQLAYAHGKLAEYDSMKSALNSSVGRDGTVEPMAEKMLDDFATEEFDKAVAAYNAGDYERSGRGFHTAISIVGDESRHREFAIATFRGAASAALARGDVKRAQESLKRAVALGDKSREMLEVLENGQIPKPPESLAQWKKGSGSDPGGSIATGQREPDGQDVALHASAQETQRKIGVGVGIYATGSSNQTGVTSFYVPITLSPSVRIEPEAGIYSQSYELSAGPSAMKYTSSTLRLGLGLFHVSWPDGSFNTYVGPRAGVLYVSSSISGMETSETGFFLGFCFGGEYSVSPSFSVGAEAQVNYLSMPSVVNPGALGNQKIFANNALMFFRWYL